MGSLSNALFLTDLPFKCPNCSHSYKHPSSLYNHSRWECGKSSEFKCHICTYETKRKSNFIRHMGNIHKLLRHQINV